MSETLALDPPGTPSATPSAERVALETSPREVLFVRFLPAPGERVVKIDLAFAGALEAALERIEGKTSARGFVFTGPGPGMFLAGADIALIRDLRDPAEAEKLAARGQRLFERIARLPRPTVAAISGPCLGGGYELALACRWRLASDHPKTKVGLPEVRLGIVPGFGGTQRLPRLLGLARALPPILTGSAYPARAAWRLGLVDDLVPDERLAELAEKAALGELPLPRRRAPRLLDRLSPVRFFVAETAKRRTLRETRGRYPAPLRAIEVASRGLGGGIARGLALEAKALAETATGPVAKNLLQLYFLREGAKRFAALDGQPLESQVKRAAVIGCGAMGAGIALLLAERGVSVRLQDADAGAIARTLERARRRFGEKVARRRMERHEAVAAMDRLQPAGDGSGLERCDLVLEAIVESLEAKRSLFAKVASRVPPGALLATNTSSLEVAAIAKGLPRPERVVGLHFFNPVEKMPLVEVVRGPETSPESAARAAALALEIEKTPLAVRDGAGFLVNRILAPYLQEASKLLVEGVLERDIDEAAVRFGLPVGPIALLDDVGLDVAAAAARTLAAAFPPRFEPPRLLERLLASQRLGRKSGTGFYRYGRNGRRVVDPDLPRVLGLPARSPGPVPQALAERLLLASVLEALRCVEEGIVERAGDVDLASVLGFGFPPDRGGILRSAMADGAESLLRRASELRARHGVRFEPCRLLLDLASSKATLA
ncbi:MAG TPA: 3-hydroxyacyl-CoA dehydrogenase NAD-binding domain-containing protein [Planctomycetota bacterium]|jgi:3-hydroxyacyl-CoA dehydrogenase/enoyl-CoA hydratase/3-hydroxybutyryl-CoA epimerase|nr:3-hydroxyacyl-CoA dehydrogenase NAD-binding domain-containing protein [Planctomycetota bacterium]